MSAAASESSHVGASGGVGSKIGWVLVSFIHGMKGYPRIRTYGSKRGPETPFQTTSERPREGRKKSFEAKELSNYEYSLYALFFVSAS